jgi:hypothetical protein
VTDIGQGAPQGYVEAKAFNEQWKLRVAAESRLAAATELLGRWYGGEWVGPDTEAFLLQQRKLSTATE